MKPPPFEHRAPGSVAEAVAVLAEYGDEAKVLAGGQSLLPLLGMRLARPQVLVDVSRIADLTTVGIDGSVRLGAAVRQRSVERSAQLAAANPLLTTAVALIGHAPIRNRGTVGGSVAHADPAAELPAVMLLTEATLVLASTKGERTVAAADFFTGFLSTAARADELLVELRLPAWPVGAGTSFQEIARRSGDFALVGAGAVVRVDRSGGGAGKIVEARLAFIGAASTAVRATAAEALLTGADISDEAIEAAAHGAVAGLEPSSDIHATGAYRRHVARVLAGRVLREAISNAH